MPDGHDALRRAAVNTIDDAAHASLSAMFGGIVGYGVAGLMGATALTPPGAILVGGAVAAGTVFAYDGLGHIQGSFDAWRSDRNILTFTGQQADNDGGNGGFTYSYAARGGYKITFDPEPTAAACVTTFLATNRSDYINLCNGVSKVQGLGGNDVIVTNGGNDTAWGGDGNDRINMGVGHDSASGGNGNDIMYGLSGNDSLSGNAGSDKIYGGTGNDRVRGGADRDYLWGESGADTFLFEEGGNDTAMDFERHDIASNFTVDRVELTVIGASSVAAGGVLAVKELWDGNNKIVIHNPSDWRDPSFQPTDTMYERYHDRITPGEAEMMLLD
jgi:Ca2+-binding RTX toxin-like protein